MKPFENSDGSRRTTILYMFENGEVEINQQEIRATRTMTNYVILPFYKIKEAFMEMQVRKAKKSYKSNKKEKKFFVMQLDEQNNINLTPVPVLSKKQMEAMHKEAIKKARK